MNNVPALSFNTDVEEFAVRDLLDLSLNADLTFKNRMFVGRWCRFWVVVVVYLIKIT